MTRMLGFGIWARRRRASALGEFVPRRTRSAQRHHEEQKWLKEEEMPRDEAAQADRDGDPHPDCRHGCNGDCLFAGSDVCTFSCHSYDVVAPVFLARITRLEIIRDQAASEIYQMKMALNRLATEEMINSAQDEDN